MSRHARSAYFVQHEKQYFVIRLGEKLEEIKELPVFLRLLNEAKAHSYAYVFGRHDQSTLPSEDALKALGAAMSARPYTPSRDSCIPAGYTYLGQFIFDDITFIGPGGDPNNKRTPALDLDSVLRLDANLNPAMGPVDAGPVPLGATSGDNEFPEDIPRIKFGEPSEGKPLIADEHNDDFLPLAQCHLMLVKFFNSIAKQQGFDTRAGAVPGSWANVLKIWLQHFQSVVLYDYLRRVVDKDTYDAVMTGGRRIVKTTSADPDESWLPIEFAAAIGASATR